MIPLLLAGLVMAIGLSCVVKAFQLTGAARRVLARKTTRIAELAEGGMEIAGVVGSREPVEGLAGLPCVAVKTNIDSFLGSGRSSTLKSQKSVTRFAPAGVQDASGTCELVLDEDTELVGPVWTATAVPAYQVVQIPWAAGLVAKDADRVTITEIAIVPGARILASGIAAQGKTMGAYRDGAPTWQLEGSPGETLILAAGTQGRLLVRAIGVPVLLFAIGIYLVGLGGMVIRLTMFL